MKIVAPWQEMQYQHGFDTRFLQTRHDSFARVLVVMRLCGRKSGFSAATASSAKSSAASLKVSRALLRAARAAWSIFPNSRRCIIVRTLKTAWPGRCGRGRSDRFSTSTSLSRQRGSSQRLSVLLDSQSRQTIRGPMMVLSQ